MTEPLVNAKFFHTALTPQEITLLHAVDTEMMYAFPYTSSNGGNVEFRPTSEVREEDRKHAMTAKELFALLVTLAYSEMNVWN